MTDTQLLHVLNPQAFLIEDFQNFLHKALSTAVFIDPFPAIVELAKSVIVNPNIGLFVTREDGEYVGLAVAGSSTTALAPGCAVLHFYNSGSAESRKLLTEAVLQFAKAHGQTKIRGVDTNRKPRGFARMFRSVGVPHSRGEVFEFEIEEADSG